MEDNIEVLVAGEEHIGYVETILETIEKAAKVRGTGIAKRTPEYVRQKMLAVSYTHLTLPTIA